jgi:hypothetical protein
MLGIRSNKHKCGLILQSNTEAKTAPLISDVSRLQMSTEDTKSVVELEMFRRFVLASGLRVTTGSERKGSAALGEPDIICELSGQSAGFELAEACAPEFAAAATAALKSSDGVAVTSGNDVSPTTLRKKIAKRYSVECPVHLLLYRNGLTVLTDDIIIARLQPELVDGLGQFQSIWFHGDETHCIAAM